VRACALRAIEQSRPLENVQVAYSMAPFISPDFLPS
jgi:hypothetical protein